MYGFRYVTTYYDMSIWLYLYVRRHKYHSNIMKLENMIATRKTEKSTFRLPLDLANQLRHMAIDEQTTVTELLIEAIQDFLAKKRGGGASKK